MFNTYLEINEQIERGNLEALPEVSKLLLRVVVWGHRGGDCMVVGFTTTYAISAYHH